VDIDLLEVRLALEELDQREANYLVGAPSHPQQSSPVRGLKLFDGRRVGESRLWEVPRVKQRDRRPLNLGQPTNIRLARRFDEIGSCHVMSLGLTTGG